MTVRELKEQLRNLDDSCMITLQTPDGSHREIIRASKQGDHLTFWTDSNS